MAGGGTGGSDLDTSENEDSEEEEEEEEEGCLTATRADMAQLLCQHPDCQHSHS